MWKTYEIESGLKILGGWKPIRMKARSAKDFIARYNNIMRYHRGFVEMGEHDVEVIKEISV